MKSKILKFVKQETVAIAACVLAVISAFFVPPDEKYLEYIDFKTLGILFSLMAITAGLQRMGVFEEISRGLFNRVKNIRRLTIMLILLCFFFSMVITNDVALITFVPFTVVLFDMLGREQTEKLLIPVVVLQTIAANLGSMLTPVGNPQNLYLYGKSGMGFFEFIQLMLPYTALSLAMLLLGGFLVGSVGNREISVSLSAKNQDKNVGRLIMYAVLFCICILAVLRVIGFEFAFAVTLCAVAIIDTRVLKRVDYSLLLTFIGFFIFIGNMGRITAFSDLIRGFVSDNEVLTAVIASQVISNVPAALLLSDFTSDIPALIVGTNIGGLGTLIASMASLISYKFISQKKNLSNGKYVFWFTFANIIFLMALLLLYIILQQT